MSANTPSPGAVNLRGSRRSFWERDWLFGLCLVGAVFIAYVRVRHAGFIWDDDSHLTQNPCVVGPLGLKEIWTSTQAVYYPLVLTSFWILHKFVGLNPAPYHILNVLMHAGSAVLLWRILRKLEVRGAWLGAALWALHPVMVQSIAWVTELKNAQSALFYLLSILWFLKADARAAGDRARWWLFGLAFLFFVMAIASKSSTVMLPAVLALCVWWRRRAIQWRVVVILVPFGLISALASVWTIWEQKFHSGAIGPDWAQTWLERLIIAGRAIWFYLGKLIWPHPLIFIYPRWEINSSELTAYLPSVITLAGLFVLWLARGKWMRPLLFAAAYFVISLFPVLGFFNVYFFRYSFVSDHFQYLASMGPIALASASVASLAGAFKGSRYLIFGAAAAIVVTLGMLTWRQSAMYTDAEGLWRTTLARNPDCWMAHECLGGYLVRRGEVREAISHYETAVNLQPNDAEAHGNLAAALVRDGRVDDAIPHWQESLKIRPDNAEIQNYLAAALLQRGQVKEAVAHWEKSLQLQPRNADTANNLGIAISQEGRMSEAIALWEKALDLQPNNVNALSNLAWVLATSPAAAIRDGAKAVEFAKRLLQLSGGANPRIFRTLAAAYAESGRFSEAIDTAQRGWELASAQGNSTLANELETNIALYRANSPLRDIPETEPSP
jgi:Flp pilus assembly protein TadD